MLQLLLLNDLFYLCRITNYIAMNFADLLTYVVMVAFFACAVWVIVTLTLSIIRKIRNFNNHGKEKL